jgi:hypothetical protein
MKRIVVNRIMLAAFLFLSMFVQAYAQTDPLPSWNDGPAKKAIVEFVKTTTDKASPKFVPPEARIGFLPRSRRIGPKSNILLRPLLIEKAYP